jgi:hypothetical protein
MSLKGILNKGVSGFLVVSVVALHCGPARAQSASDSAAAQALFDQGRALLSEGRTAEACPKLEESQRLDPKSGTLLNLAHCYEQEARYLEAVPAARAAGNPEREAVARERAAALSPRLAKLVVNVAPALKGLEGLQVLREGAVIGPAQWGLEIPADEGEHRVAATAPGYKPWEATMVVKGEGARVSVEVPMLEREPRAQEAGTGVDLGAPSSVAPASGLGAQRIGAIVAGGVGVLGLGAGAFFGLQAQSKKDEADKLGCVGGECPTQAGVDAGKGARSAGTLSTILVGVGAVGVAAGVTLWFTAPEAPGGGEGIGMSVGLGSVQLKGSW